MIVEGGWWVEEKEGESEGLLTVRLKSFTLLIEDRLIFLSPVGLELSIFLLLQMFREAVSDIVELGG